MKKTHGVVFSEIAQGAINTHVRELVAFYVLAEIAEKMGEHNCIPLGKPEFKAFLGEWRAVAFVLEGDEGYRLWDAERAAEVACGFAFDLGMRDAEIERLRRAA